MKTTGDDRSRLPTWRTEISITLLGLVGLALLLGFYQRAFPTAALDLSLARAEIRERATVLLQEQGLDLEGYTTALTFTDDFWASIYLQQTLGVAQTNEILREGRVPIWYWQARWFRPLQKEEYRVHVEPSGRIVSWYHILPEDAPGAALSQQEARALAETYLTEEHGWDLVAWEEISASSEERPGGRVDHAFEWRQRAWDVGESELRLQVTLQGETLGSYNHWLKVPETFQRTFSQKLNIAGFVNNASLLGGAVLISLIFFLALWQADWQLPFTWSEIWLPMLGVVVVALSAGLNDLPLAKTWYNTTQEYPLFWTEQVLNVIASALFSGFAIFMLWIMGRWMSKQIWPREDRILSRRGHRTHHLARSGWRGLMLSLIMGGYLVLFYLIATEFFGGWTPLLPEYQQGYATPLPFLGALRLGLLPAMWEELFYRLLAISATLWLLRRYAGSLPRPLRRFLALLIPGALWGFAHLSYIRDPFYLRGIELTLAAILLEGLFFLKFDLTTTIVAHFAYNAGFTALPLLRSGDPYLVVSGFIVVVVMFAPIIYGAVLSLRQKRTTGAKSPTLREAKAADLEALNALPCTDIAWQALLTDEAATVLCLQSGDELAGVAAGRIDQDNIGEVVAIYVAPHLRRRYWGSEMMTELTTRLRKGGAISLVVAARTDDQVWMNFWISQGWRPAVRIFVRNLALPAKKLHFPSGRPLTILHPASTGPIPEDTDHDTQDSV
ncbi:MAG: GNAT family N-acetyltransferase [Anaerolineae bacterium]